MRKKRIVLYASLIFIGSVLGGSTVYAAGNKVQAVLSVFQMSVDRNPSANGTRLIYQGQSYLPSNLIIQQLRSVGYGAGWSGSQFNVSIDENPTLRINDDLVSTAYNEIITDLQSVDLSNTSQLSTYSALVTTDISKIKDQLHTVASWAVNQYDTPDPNTKIDVQLKNAWIDLFSLELANCESFERQINDVIDGNSSDGTAMFNEQGSFVSEANQILSEINNLESLEGWSSTQ